MSTRARIIAAQAAAVAALVLVVYLTLLRDDPNAPIPDIQAPGGEQVQGGPDLDGGDDGKRNGKRHDGHGDGSPGLDGPAGTGTVIVGGPAWMGSFAAPATTTASTDTDSPPTDQYADSVGKLLGKVGAGTINPNGTTSSTDP